LNINATLLGEIMIVFILVVGALSYYLGRRKTQTPILAGLLGLVLSIIPPFGLVYLVVLVLKKDVGSTSEAVSG
jgi:4-hydroxybenzoate polyprenyltransferase